MNKTAIFALVFDITVASYMAVRQDWFGFAVMAVISGIQAFIVLKVKR
jgi:hypothetical protein